MKDIAIVIPSIPPRAAMLQRALDSVHAQTLEPAQIIVEIDHDRSGAPVTRTRGLEKVTCAHVAFLDDDDELLPYHLETLANGMDESDADLVYAWFTVVGGTDPFPQHFGKPWDDADPRQTTITTLVKTEAIREVGGFISEEFRMDQEDSPSGEDFRMVCRLVQRGYKIVHVPERTWLWHHHGGNTSGLPCRW